MKKKVWMGLLALAVAVAAAALLSGLLGGGNTLPEGAAALYKDTPISEETVAYLENTYAQAGQTVSREKIIDQLLMNCVVEEAASQGGFAAGEDEVAALLDVQRQTYAEFPEARDVVDGYCEEQGITLEDYWALAEEQARHTILRAKYQEWFYAARLPEQEIDPEKNPQQAQEAYEEHCRQLLSAASGRITRR